MLTKAQAQKIALSFEGATEGLNYGKPTVLFAGKFFARVDHKEEAVELEVGSMEMRDMMLETQPGLFYITDHHKKFPYLLARLSKLSGKTLKELLSARALRIAAKRPKNRAGKIKKRKSR